MDGVRLLDARITGRITPESLGALADGVDALLADDRPFAVVFDRRAMTAPTPEGRQALEQWAARTMPKLAGHCVAWADVLDEPRAESLQRGGSRNHSRRNRGSRNREEPRYPQRIFTDEDAAREWALAALATAVEATQGASDGVVGRCGGPSADSTPR